MLNQADNANIHIWASDLSFSYGRQGGRTSWEGWVDILRQNSLGWYEFVLNIPIFPYSSWRKLGQPAQRWASGVSHPDYAISRNSSFFHYGWALMIVWWRYLDLKLLYFTGKEIVKRYNISPLPQPSLGLWNCSFAILSGLFLEECRSPG